MDPRQRRAQLLDAAAAVFAEKGYHLAKVDDFVARVGVARGTFYLYFEDKRSIFEELVDRFMERLMDVVIPIELGDPAVDAREALRANLLRVVERFDAEPALAKILLSTAVGIDPGFDRKLVAFYDAITALLERALDQGVEAGLVRPGPIRIRSFCLVGLLKELLYQLLLRDVAIPPGDLVDALLDLLEGGLFVHPTPSGG